MTPGRLLAGGRAAGAQGASVASRACVPPVPHCLHTPCACAHTPQGVGLTQLPSELLDKSRLTRLDLMVNQLTVSRAGWVGG